MHRTRRSHAHCTHHIISRVFLACLCVMCVCSQHTRTHVYTYMFMCVLAYPSGCDVCSLICVLRVYQNVAVMRMCGKLCGHVRHRQVCACKSTLTCEKLRSAKDKPGFAVRHLALRPNLPIFARFGCLSCLVHVYWCRTVFFPAC